MEPSSPRKKCSRVDQSEILQLLGTRRRYPGRDYQLHWTLTESLRVLAVWPSPTAELYQNANDSRISSRVSMVRNYVPRGSNELHGEEKIFRAVQQVKLHGRSIRQVAVEFDIPKSTLSYRASKYEDKDVQDDDSICVRNNWRLIVPEEMEEQLAAHILRCAEMYIGLTPKDVRTLAYELAVANNLSISVRWKEEGIAGKEWFSLFLSRHKQLAIRVPEATSVARICAFNPDNVATFFQNLMRVLVRYNFLKCRIWNMDESGLQTVHKPGKIVAQKGLKQVGAVVTAERGETVTIAATISASGANLPPFFIFPRVNYNESAMLANCPEGSVGVAFPTGYMNKVLFLQYLKHFVTETGCTPQCPHLLILDNHASHVAIESVKFAKENGIVLLTLPPHTSHKLQPLDKSIFGPLKSAMNKVMNVWVHKNPRKTMRITQIARFVNQVYSDVFTQSNIRAGFRATGICPFASSIFKKSDFAPSLITNRPNPDEACSEESEDDDCVIPRQDEPSTSRGSYILPAEVRPIRTASPIQEKASTRRKGKTAILTDTPEMLEMEGYEEAKLKKTKTSKKKPKKSKKIAEKNENKDNSVSLDVDHSMAEIPSLASQECEILEPQIQKSKKNTKIIKNGRHDFIQRNVKTEASQNQKSKKTSGRSQIDENDYIPAKKSKMSTSQISNSKRPSTAIQIDDSDSIPVKKIKIKLNKNLVEERIVIKPKKINEIPDMSGNPQSRSKRVLQPNRKFAEYLCE